MHDAVSNMDIQLGLPCVVTKVLLYELKIEECLVPQNTMDFPDFLLCKLCIIEN